MSVFNMDGIRISFESWVRRATALVLNMPDLYTWGAKGKSKDKDSPLDSDNKMVAYTRQLPRVTVSLGAIEKTLMLEGAMLVIHWRGSVPAQRREISKPRGPRRAKERTRRRVMTRHLPCALTMTHGNQRQGLGGPSSQGGRQSPSGVVCQNE